MNRQASYMVTCAEIHRSVHRISCYASTELDLGVSISFLRSQNHPVLKVIERNRWTVNIEIVPSHSGEWFLRISDDRGNATCWVEPFDTEQAALDAAICAIDVEGIETFIGPHSEMRFMFDS